jgi:hypothetical protein
MEALHGTDIPGQVVALTANAGKVPSACQVHLKTTDPRTFDVYVFWTP